MKRALAVVLVGLAAAFSTMPASVRMPPIAEKIASYRGLFAPAHIGNVAALGQLAKAGAGNTQKNADNSKNVRKVVGRIGQI